MRILAFLIIFGGLVKAPAPVNFNKTETAVVPQQVQAAANESPQPTEKEAVQPIKQEPSPQPVNVESPEPIVPTTNREIGQQMAAEVGWTDNQWLCLEKLWTNESNWRESVANYEGSGAYGIPQALPAHKMASHGQDYLTNPRTQIAWGLDYIKSRYKTPCDALAFWNNQSPHWY